jgi:hypothetical protein
MDTSLPIIALCALKDAVNPCALVIMTALLYAVAELRRRGFNAPWGAALYIAAVFMTLLVLSLGALMSILYTEAFYSSARKFYLVIGLLFLVGGGLHWCDWMRLRRPREGDRLFFPFVLIGEDAGTRLNIPATVLVIGSAVLLSALSTIWPMDPYVTFYSSFLMLPGKTIETYITLFVYNFVFVLPFIGVFVFVSSDYFSKLVRKVPSMVKIVESALTLALGAGLVYIFR